MNDDCVCNRMNGGLGKGDRGRLAGAFSLIVVVVVENMFAFSTYKKLRNGNRPIRSREIFAGKVGDAISWGQRPTRSREILREKSDAAQITENAPRSKRLSQGAPGMPSNRPRSSLSDECDRAFFRDGVASFVTDPFLRMRLRVL